MSSEWIGIVAVGLAGLGHVVATVWWASRVTTLLEIVRRDLNQLQSDVKAFNQNCFTKADATRELVGAEKEHKALWKRHDELRDRVEAIAGGRV